MAETRCFISWLVNCLASYVQWWISGRGRTDWRRWHDAFSWYDQWRQHNATSSGRGWTDQRQRHNASSLSWSKVRLIMCNGKSAGTGGLIDSCNTMLFLGMINCGNTMLLHLAGWWWEGTLATRLARQTKFWHMQKLIIIQMQEYIMNIRWRVQWLELLGIVKPNIIEKSKLYHFIQFFFRLKHRIVWYNICYTWQMIFFWRKIFLINKNHCVKQPVEPIL